MTEYITPSSITTPPASSPPNEAFHVPGMFIGTEDLPKTVPIAAASSAMIHCASAPGGLRTDGSIHKGCRHFFEHLSDCFSSNSPWSDPYDAARSQSFQDCVCMTTDADPFSEYSALWKNFTGCAACLHTAVDFDIMPWLNSESRRLWSFCLSQEPNAFTFMAVLKNWFYRLDDWQHIDNPPLEAAFGADGRGGGMNEMLQHYTGRPPLANMPWGTSALPSGKFEGVTPSLTVFPTTIETQGAALTMSASSLVAWIPTAAGETWEVSAAAAKESAAMEVLLSSALCLGEDHSGCQISEASKRMDGAHAVFIWILWVGLAGAIGWAAVWIW